MLHLSRRESSMMICLQVLPSYLLAGQGMVTAGMLLDRVQMVTDVFRATASPPVGVRYSTCCCCSVRHTLSAKVTPCRAGGAEEEGRAHLQSPPNQTHPEMKRSLCGRQHNAGKMCTEEDGWKHQRPEKKLLAFWMTLSFRTWSHFRSRERSIFQRSTSATRLLKKSEA
ncbi:hypothetical protein FQA47_025593 [Oryzias melastigma]|uniref:Uncharacterized protein n=1 Tax=Oryzias melastigma TaxID=30732 RepID=A0A834CAZ0_ORYME|nr:hypothetical protein FQA47_025593 [Oryzias melastigma]